MLLGCTSTGGEGPNTRLAMNSLKEKLEIAEKALRFYKDKKTWRKQSQVNYLITSKLDAEKFEMLYYGGNIA